VIAGFAGSLARDCPDASVCEMYDAVAPAIVKIVTVRAITVYA